MGTPRIIERPKRSRWTRPHVIAATRLKASGEPLVPLHDGEPQPLGDVETGCRWMHGDPSRRLFCGAPKKDQAWCAHHFERVFA